MSNRNKFYHSVGKSKRAMIDFLNNHFKYDTMSAGTKVKAMPII